MTITSILKSNINLEKSYNNNPNEYILTASIIIIDLIKNLKKIILITVSKYIFL